MTKDDMISGIYKIENLINHKVYIGQSKDVMNRFKQHVDFAKRGRGRSYLYFSMNHYGVDNFSFEIIKETYDLDKWERFFIYWYQSTNKDYGYNLTTGGQKNGKRTDNFVYTEDMKQKMSKSAKRNWNDEDYRKQIITFQNKGKWTDKARKNRSLATKRMWENGKFENQAKKLSEYWIGFKRSEETKKRMRESSKLRELKHHQDYEIYLSNGGDLNYHEFCKYYKKGINQLLEV